MAPKLFASNTITINQQLQKNDTPKSVLDFVEKQSWPYARQVPRPIGTKPSSMLTRASNNRFNNQRGGFGSSSSSKYVYINPAASSSKVKPKSDCLKKQVEMFKCDSTWTQTTSEVVKYKYSFISPYVTYDQSNCTNGFNLNEPINLRHFQPEIFSYSVSAHYHQNNMHKQTNRVLSEPQKVRKYSVAPMCSMIENRKPTYRIIDQQDISYSLPSTSPSLMNHYQQKCHNQQQMRQQVYQNKNRYFSNNNRVTYNIQYTISSHCINIF